MNTAEVFNPSHYGGKDDPFETMKVLEAWLTPDEMIGFCKGNAIKYQSRHRAKGGATDLAKAAWYNQYLVQYLAKRSLTAYGPNTLAPDMTDPADTKSAAPSDTAGTSDTGLEPLPAGAAATYAGSPIAVGASRVDQQALEDEIAAMAQRLAPARAA